ncbi:MAG: hypothetical protein N2043_12445 [Ignavibacterium sp.]|nr:hypothetical protein [Ignavibacterium sp.]
MKSLVFALVFVLVAGNLHAQRWEMRENQRKRIEEFKKIKLIEALDLSEEESTRFFSLYNEHQKKIRTLQREREQTIDQLSKLTKDESKFNVKKFEELEKRLNEIDQELFRNRQEFHSDIKNVLSPYKVAKFYVFERDFIRELNRIIMMRRNPNPPEE